MRPYRPSVPWGSVRVSRPGLNVGSKILLMVLMFFGRVGILTISFAFMTKTPPANAIRRPETRVLIG